MGAARDKITRPDLPRARRDESMTRVRAAEPHRLRYQSVTEETTADLTRDPRVDPE